MPLSTADLPEPSVGRDVRVLLVEDDEADAFLTRRLLESTRTARYAVTWIARVEDALQHAHASPPDACIVDYNLSTNNGLEFLAETRRRGFRFPVIMLTGSTSADLDIEAMRAGAADYLCKEGLTAERLERSIRYGIERKRTEQALMLAARRDPLTGLHNRTSLSERLEVAIARQRRQQSGVTVLAIDLDGFKEVNDTLGHQAGDHLLAVLAKRLTAVVRPYDVVARLGGDEFVIVVEDLSEQESCGPRDDLGGCASSTRVLGLAQRVFDSILEPVRIDGAPVCVSASIGVARCPAHQVTADLLLRRADKAMYRAKMAGKGGISFFDSETDSGDCDAAECERCPTKATRLSDAVEAPDSGVRTTASPALPSTPESQRRAAWSR